MPRLGVVLLGLMGALTWVLKLVLEREYSAWSAALARFLVRVAGWTHPSRRDEWEADLRYVQEQQKETGLFCATSVFVGSPWLALRQAWMSPDLAAVRLYLIYGTGRGELIFGVGLLAGGLGLLAVWAGALALRLGLVAPAVASHIFWVGDIAGGAGLLAGGVGFLARRVRPPRLKPATHAGRRTFETG